MSSSHLYIGRVFLDMVWNAVILSLSVGAILLVGCLALF